MKRRELRTWVRRLGYEHGKSGRCVAMRDPDYKAGYRRGRRERNLTVGVRIRHVHIPLSARKEDA